MTKSVGTRKRELNKLVKDYGYHRVLKVTGIQHMTLGMYLDDSNPTYKNRCVTQEKLELIRFKLG